MIVEDLLSPRAQTNGIAPFVGLEEWHSSFVNEQRFHAGECLGIGIVDLLDVEHRLVHFEHLRDLSLGDGKEGELLQEFDAQGDATGDDQLRVPAEQSGSVDEDPLQHITQLQLNIYLLIT